MDQLNWFCFLLLIGSLPFGLNMIRILWYVWLGSWVFSWLIGGRFMCRPNLNVRHLLPALAMIVFLFLSWLSIRWSFNLDAAARAVGRELNVLGLLPILLWGVNKKYNWQTALRVLLWSALLSVLVYLLLYFWLSNPARAFDKFILNTNHIDFLHLDNMLIETKHRMYYANVLTMALVALVLLRPYFKQHYDLIERIFYYPIIVIWLLAGIYWSGSRASWLNIVVIGGVMIMQGLTNRKRIIVAIAVVAALGLQLVAVNIMRPRGEKLSFAERFEYHPENTYTPSAEPRVAIWHTVFENWREYPWYGLGIGNAEDYLAEKYEAKGWELYAHRHFSPHNQYLEIWMELGWIVALLFIAYWAYLPWCYESGRQRKFVMAFVAMIMCSMLTECLLAGQEGIISTCIMLILAVVLPTEKSETELHS